MPHRVGAGAYDPHHYRDRIDCSRDSAGASRYRFRRRRQSEPLHLRPVVRAVGRWRHEKSGVFQTSPPDASESGVPRGYRRPQARARIRRGCQIRGDRFQNAGRRACRAYAAKVLGPRCFTGHASSEGLGRLRVEFKDDFHLRVHRDAPEHFSDRRTADDRRRVWSFNVSQT